MTAAGIILAAGDGTRMRTKKPKPLHTVAGLALVAHTVQIMRLGGIEEIRVVLSQELAGNPVMREVLAHDIGISIQRESRGTADALKAVRSVFIGADTSGADTLVVAPVDMILVTGEFVRRMIALHRETGALSTILASNVDDASGLGRVKLDDLGQPVSVIEEDEADEGLLQSNLVNTAWYCFDNNWIWDAIDSIQPSHSGEVYLPQVIEKASKLGRSMMLVSNDDDGRGINDLIQLADVEKIVRGRTNEFHMKNGVKIQDPSSTYIDVDVEIGFDTQIGAGSHIGTGSKIGCNVTVGSNTKIIRSQIADSAVVDGARVVDSIIGEKCFVGSNSLVRSGSELKTEAKVGNLVEVKNSVIGSGSQISHFSYMGDATVGQNVNIGAGTVTCNYDGIEKHRTVIGDGALIGSNTMLIAPVKIGNSARTGAGAVVRSDVCSGETVVGVPAKSLGSR